jgi:hypothetical protein
VSTWLALATVGQLSLASGTPSESWSPAWPNPWTSNTMTAQSAAALTSHAKLIVPTVVGLRKSPRAFRAVAWLWPLVGVV